MIYRTLRRTPAVLLEEGRSMGRRIFSTMLASVLAWAVLSSGPASAQIKMSIGWDPPAGEHPMAVAGNEFKKRVEQYTKGQIQVQVYCCFKMGSEEEMVKKLQLGTLDATVVA